MGIQGWNLHRHPRARCRTAVLMAGYARNSHLDKHPLRDRMRLALHGSNQGIFRSSNCPPEVSQLRRFGDCIDLRNEGG